MLLAARKAPHLTLRLLTFTTFLLVFCPSLLLAEDQFAQLEAITKASADIELSFAQAGKLIEIMVQEGDLVKNGDILARQEDGLERIQLEIISAKSNNLTEVNLAATALRQKQRYLGKMKAAVQSGAATDWEMEQASFEKDAALISKKMADLEHEQDKLQQKSIEESLRRLHLFSTLDGVVEEIRAEKGESIQALQTVLRIVNIDLIEIDVPVPLLDARKLRVQQKVTISYADKDKIEGYIDTISSIADGAADTLNVKVKARNISKRPAGERVRVVFADTAPQS